MIIRQSIAAQLLQNSQPLKPAQHNNEPESAPNNVLAIVSKLDDRARSTFSFGVRHKLEPIYEFTAKGSTQDVHEEKDIVEHRDIYETRAVYEETPILETNTVGSVDLSVADGLGDLGLETKEKLTIKVGDGPIAVINFVKDNKIQVKIEGTTQNFTFSEDDGSFRTELLNALNSIGGLTASYTSDGRLSLVTAEAAPLTIAQKGKVPDDPAQSPIAKLGLEAGTIEPVVVGYTNEQIGTEQVKVGTEAIVIGTQPAKVGTKQVLEAYDRELVGLKWSDELEVDVGGMQPFAPGSFWLSDGLTYDLRSLVLSDWSSQATALQLLEVIPTDK